MTNLGFSRGENRLRFTLNRPGRRACRETTREGAAILEGTVENPLFSHEEQFEAVLALEPNACFWGFTFGVFWAFGSTSLKGREGNRSTQKKQTG